jgi:hypothetical protein
LLKDQNESNRFNYVEFKILINELKHVVLNTLPSSKEICKFKFRSLAKILFIREKNFQIGIKLISDSKNWAIIVNILAELLRITLNKTNKSNDLIMETLMINLLTVIFSVQTGTNEKKMYPQIEPKVKYDTTPDKSYFYFQLIQSYFEYLRDNKKEMKDSVLLYLLKSYSHYMGMISNSTSFIQLCKEDKEFEKHYENFNKYLELFMRKHANFYSLPQEIKEDFFSFFSFNKEKWSNSVQLIQNDVGLCNILILYYSIIGSIRFNDNEKFKWLCDLLKNHNFNSSTAIHYQHSIDSFSIYFLKTKIKYFDDLEENLELLLETWNNLCHWPEPGIIDEFNKFINEINFRKSDREHRDGNNRKINVNNIQVNYKGVCSNGHKLPIKTYDNQTLQRMAEPLRKTNLPSPFKENFLKNLDELKEFLKYEKFDYVIDGMNMIYLGNRLNVENLIILLELLDKNKSKLIILRTHVKQSMDSPKFRKVEKMYPNLKFVFYENRLPDDRFVLYAALLSGNETFIISNDNFHDSLYGFEKNKALFRMWLINRRILCHTFFKKLYYPPLFDVNVNKVDKNTWFIPYLNTARDNPFNEPRFFLFLKKT